jgi:hypothetical protein
LHEQFGDVLKRSVLVGFTHGQTELAEAPPPGPVPEFFFAPDEMAAAAASSGSGTPRLGRRSRRWWSGRCALSG